MLSLVQTSFNRIEELKRFVYSLNSQKDIDLSQVQLIFIDQGNCKEAFNNIDSKIDFTYVKYNPSSLSHARNVGLQYVKGRYVSFPDDDCWYHPDTLSLVLEQLSMHDGVLIKATNEDGIPLALFPSLTKRATIYDHCGACSICIFLHYDKSIKFDENIGVGSPYGLASGEETDYLINYFKIHPDVIYCHNIVIHHPLGKTTFFKDDLDKSYKYARGNGYVMKKHHYPIFMVCRALIRPFGGIIINLLRGNLLLARRSYLLLKGRIEGLSFGYTS